MMSATAAAHRLIGGRTAAVATIMLAGVALHLLIWQVSEPTVIFSDFFKAYYPAGRSVWYDGAVAPWTLRDGAALTFINIPILAWAFVPFAVLGESVAPWTYLAVGLAAALAAWGLLVRLARLDARGSALLFLAFAVNGPMVNSLREGNSTHILLFLLVAALLLWRTGRDYPAGLVLGLCAVLKLPFLLFGVYFLLRGRWRVVAGGATTVVTVMLLSLLYFGPDINLAWVRCCVEPFTLGTVPAFNVQSIDGFLLRLLTGAGHLRDWTPMEPPAALTVIRVVLFATLYGGTFWLIQRAGARQSAIRATGLLSARDLVEFVLVVNLAVVTSPVSWTHYYLLLLLPWSLYVGDLLSLPDDAVTRRLMGAGFLLASLPVVMPEFGSGLLAEIAARTLVSAWLFGGLMMLAALMRGAWRPEHWHPEHKGMRMVAS
jgi:alpha-1,2-mannosyltransferase